MWEEVVEAERRGKVRLWVEIVVEEGKEEVVGGYCVGDGRVRGCTVDGRFSIAAMECEGNEGSIIENKCHLRKSLYSFVGLQSLKI